MYKFNNNVCVFFYKCTRYVVEKMLQSARMVSDDSKMHPTSIFGKSKFEIRSSFKNNSKKMTKTEIFTQNQFLTKLTLVFCRNTKMNNYTRT